MSAHGGTQQGPSLMQELFWLQNQADWLWASHFTSHRKPSKFEILKSPTKILLLFFCWLVCSYQRVFAIQLHYHPSWKFLLVSINWLCRTPPPLQLSNAQSDLSVIILSFNQKESKSWISTGRNQSGLRPSSFITKGSHLNFLFFGNQPSKRESEALPSSLIIPIWSPNVVGNQPRGIK